MTDPLREHVDRFADDPALAARMADFYERLDAAIAARRPLCVNRGACCRFAEYGHRLYVTAVELAYFIGRQRDAGLRPVESTGACPYQIGGMCTAREHRPLGCRVFFCDPAARGWQGPQYEHGLAQLKQIGADLGVEYHYVEWLDVLDRVTPAGVPR